MLAKVDRSTQKPRVRHISRPRQPFWGPLAAILDFVGGAVLQAVSECPRHCKAGILQEQIFCMRTSNSPYLCIYFTLIKSFALPLYPLFGLRFLKFNFKLNVAYFASWDSNFVQLAWRMENFYRGKYPPSKKNCRNYHY